MQLDKEKFSIANIKSYILGDLIYTRYIFTIYKKNMKNADSSLFW